MLSLSQRGLFEIFVDEDRKTPARGKLLLKTVTETVQNKLKLESLTELQTNIIEGQLRKYRKFKDQHLKQKGLEFIVSLASDTEIIIDSFPTCSSPEKKMKCNPPLLYRKTFRDLGSRMQKERTNNIVEYLQEYIKQECPELSLNNLLGYILERENKQGGKDIATIGSQLFNDSFELYEPIDLEDAVTLMHSLVLTKEQMRKMRIFLSKKGIHFPTTNEILRARKKLRPVVMPCLTGKGVFCDYKELVRMTISSVIDIVLKEETYQFLEGDSYQAEFKEGGDGAGQMPKMNSKEMSTSQENIFQYSMTILKFSCTRNDGQVVVMWENPSPNSAKCVRPVYLIREKETDDELLNLVIPSTDQARDNLNANGMTIHKNGRSIFVSLKIQDTMKDLKFKRDISGLKGADCILCETKTEDWTTRERVINGFPINRRADETWQLYLDLVNEVIS